MKNSVLTIILLLASTSLSFAQSPTTIVADYGPLRMGGSSVTIGSFNVSASVAAPATAVLSIVFNIDDLANDGDIEGRIYLDGSMFAYSQDGTPDVSTAPRTGTLTIIGQMSLSPGNHTISIQISGFGAADAYDIRGRWACTVVRYGEASVALTNAINMLQAADTANRDALQSQIDSLAALLNEEVVDLQMQIDALNAQIAAMQEAQGVQALQIAALEARAMNLENALNEAVGTLTEYVDTRLAALKTELETAIAEGDDALAASLQSQIKQVKTIIATLATKERVNGVESWLLTVDNRLKEVEALSREFATKEYVRNLQEELQTKITEGDQTAIGKLQKQINALERRLSSSDNSGGSSDGGNSSGSMLGAVGIGLGVTSLGWQVYDAVRPGFEQKKEERPGYYEQ